MNRQCWRRRHLTTCDGGDKLLLTTLRVLNLQRCYRDNKLLLLDNLIKIGNRIGLIILNTDYSLLNTQRLLKNLNTNQKLLTTLQHGTVVRCKIRLTLNTIYNKVFGLASIGD